MVNTHSRLNWKNQLKARNKKLHSGISTNVDEIKDTEPIRHDGFLFCCKKISSCCETQNTRIHDMKKKTITVDGSYITLVPMGKEDYISLTDIDQRFEGNGRHIENWLRNQNTIEYLTVWETLYNPNFNSLQLHGIREKVGLNRFILSAKKWIELTNAIGLKASAGRYGGTYAHLDIAFHFCLWLSPTFQLYVAKEFQRLKEGEAKELHQSLTWDLRRELAKVNYRVHTDAVQMHLIPPQLTEKEMRAVFTSEADLLNVAMFGVTAKEWKTANPKAKGNIRDYATAEQLLVLANLENLNAHFIKEGMSAFERLHKLNEIAIYQMQLLTRSDEMQGLKELFDGK